MERPYYESSRALGEYLLFHFGPSEVLAPYAFAPESALHFPVRCVRELVDQERLSKHGRALDLGCAVGRSTFELARLCNSVTGIDASAQFIAAANELRDKGRLPFRYVTEGELEASAVAAVPAEVERQRVAFEQGNAEELREDLGQFDLVLLANLIDRLPNPRQCLEQMADILCSGGQLIITSPYTWLAEYTPRENWLGGFYKDGKAVKTRESLKAILTNAFELVFVRDMPFLIREHARKFQWSVAEATVWTRR